MEHIQQENLIVTCYLCCFTPMGNHWVHVTLVWIMVARPVVVAISVVVAAILVCSFVGGFEVVIGMTLVVVVVVAHDVVFTVIVLVGVIVVVVVCGGGVFTVRLHPSRF